jgi:hypothetical protein
MLITARPADPKTEEELRRLQYTPEECDRRFPPKPPFSYAEWQREAPPATPEELGDWEEFLRQREAEREASLVREAGLTP